jgi:hypothetical protein
MFVRLRRVTACARVAVSSLLHSPSLHPVANPSFHATYKQYLSSHVTCLVKKDGGVKKGPRKRFAAAFADKKRRVEA